MSLNDLANLGQIIGALAVVISLFYVAHQIRQNTNAVRSATAQAVHEHFAKWYHLVRPMMSLHKSLRGGCATTRRFRKRRSPVRRRIHGVSLLFAERISEVARRIARTTAMAWLGACHYEPCLRARWQGVLGKNGLICLVMNSADISKMMS